MEREHAICSLDYLTGTLATAYKGMILSLVAKDFCIMEDDTTVVLRGTILSMPEGEYYASLMREGREIARTALTLGLFEFEVSQDAVQEATNLQIDVIQRGRHIGTFLLTREKTDGFFSSALELSREIAGIDFRQRTALLAEKPGLLQSAEKIISKVFSTKKDWKALSDDLNSFSKDLFWFAKDAFYGWYDLIVRFEVRACEKADVREGDKPLANLLSVIELPLEQEEDHEKLRTLLGTWIEGVKTSSVSLSSRMPRVLKVLSLVGERFPDADLSPLRGLLIASLQNRCMKTRALPEKALKALRAVMGSDDLAALEPYSGKHKEELILGISAAEAAGGERSPAALLKRLGTIVPLLPDDTAMIERFFSATEKNLTATSAPSLGEAVIEIFSLFPELSPDANKKALLGSAGFLRRMIELRMFDACREMLERLGRIASSAEEAILFNPAMAASVLHSDDEGLRAAYTAILQRIIIPAPKVTGFSGDTWAEIVNPLHLERLSRFLAIIRVDSKRFRDLLIHVICNLYVGGVLIPDEKLFQREVSDYLNSGVPGVDFLLHSLLLQKLPVYYNEVGAFGAIRDDSTEIDSWGNDPLLYFLRKQVHVNASNHNIRLIEEIIRSWVFQDPLLLKDVVPEDVFGRVTRELLARYSPARTVFETLGILDKGGLHVEKVLLLSESDLQHGLEGLATPKEIGAKIVLLCRIYREIVKKYSSLPGHVDTGDIPAALSGYTEKITRLRETVLSPEKTTPQEALFFKRHIAFGIPSVMGSYHEQKFDAFGEMLRTETFIRVLLERLIEEIGQRREDFTAADVAPWISCLGNLGVLLTSRGLKNFQMDEVFTVLRTNRLYFSQIIDLLRICQKELAWTVRSLRRLFEDPLMAVLNLFPPDDLPERLKRLGPGGKDSADKAADIVMRDIISSVAGLTELDRVLLVLLSFLNEREASGSDEEMVPPAGPATLSSEFFVLDELTDDDAMRLLPSIGSKAKNLVYLRTKGLRVPPAIIFPSSWTPVYRERTREAGFREILMKAVQRIEARTGTIFGDDKRPLFLSVRSGSSLSMPGILSSILYCGTNERTLKGLIEHTGSPWLGWDSFRRFIEHYGEIVYGLDPAIFAATGAEYMKTLGKEKREDLGSEQMKELVGLLLNELSQRGLTIPEDFYDQLKASVQAVYASWYGTRAKQFREAMGISGHWGTAVMLMEMVYGNDAGSGASVFFTRNPFSLRKGIYGDTKEKASGDDLVSGGSSSMPLAREQAFGARKSLEESDPLLFSLHQDLASKIEGAMGGLPQEIEAVYRKQPNGERIIHVLQTRRMETHRGFTKRFTDVCAMRLNVIGRGAGVNGGQMSGIATFSPDPEAIRRLKEEHPLPLILLRKTASTADVSLMPLIDGILTSFGGVASHASVLAQKFNLTAIVGCPDMEIRTDEKGEPFAQIGRHPVREGSVISIDGSTGLVYSGSCPGAEEGEE